MSHIFSKFMSEMFAQSFWNFDQGNAIGSAMDEGQGFGHIDKDAKIKEGSGDGAYTPVCLHTKKCVIFGCDNYAESGTDYCTTHKKK